MVDRFEELRTYIAIVETGGVNAAAAKMGIARSATSRRLSELEARLGITLVERSTRRFELTSAGQRYYSESKRVIDELAKIDSAVAHGSIDATNISIAVSPDHVGVVATAFVSFLGAHPEASLHIVSADRRDDADLTISTTEANGARTIGELDPIIAGSPAYLEKGAEPESPADLEHHVAIVTEGAPDAWTFRSGARVAPRAAVTTSDAASAMTLAIAGAGLAQLPRSLCAPAIAAGLLVEVLAAAEPKPQSLFAHARDGSPAAAALLDHIIAAARR